MAAAFTPARDGEASASRVPAVEMRGVSKAFPGVQALSDVSMVVDAGEVHMLLGQNGAGKSTLIKILYGAYHPDSGEFLIDGRQVRITSPAAARRLGIGVIFQEFSLVPHLSVAQNLFLGREPSGRIPFTIDYGQLHDRARQVLDALQIDVDVRLPVHRLGVAQQQMVEIAKALSQNARILVMDEPTAALSEREIDVLFDRIRSLRRDGMAIVYISHRLREVFEIGDRITVLRDGQRVATARPGDTTARDLVRMMVGRDLEAASRTAFCSRPGEVVLQTRNLSAANGVSGVDVQVRAGEIVGFAGLVGAGRTELARAIFGLDRRLSGEVSLRGQSLPGDPVVAVRRGIGLVPESRQAEGLALMHSVQDNALLAGLRRHFPRGWYRPRRARRLAAGLIEQLHIATPSPNRAVKYLSGGNQQKVVVAKWLSAESRVFIFDEPTRGIDVGGKAEIYRLLERLVADGAAVMLISSELPELVAVCDRAYVMRDKTIVGELLRGELTEENILRLAMHHE
jgi:ribose transport system ATP-binding protein